jgi:hypothetical protein
MLLIAAGLLFNAAAYAGMNCDLVVPPDSSGETQAHGEIIYVYPRNADINAQYNGCQTRWFKDGDHDRKLGVTYYAHGMAVAYDNINISGEVAYHCRYTGGASASDNDGRCPEYDQLTIKTYRAGCLSEATLNVSNSLYPVSADCVLE